MKDDTISRQGAIDICNFAIDFWHGQLGEGIVIAVRKRIEQLPSAQPQPEIIYCKDCKHRDPEDKKCDCGHDILWQLPRDDNWFCADAERRTDE